MLAEVEIDGFRVGEAGRSGQGDVRGPGPGRAVAPADHQADREILGGVAAIVGTRREADDVEGGVGVRRCALVPVECEVGVARGDALRGEERHGRELERATRRRDPRALRVLDVEGKRAARHVQRREVQVQLRAGHVVVETERTAERRAGSRAAVPTAFWAGDTACAPGHAVTADLERVDAREGRRQGERTDLRVQVRHTGGPRDRDRPGARPPAVAAEACSAELHGPRRDRRGGRGQQGAQAEECDADGVAGPGRRRPPHARRAAHHRTARLLAHAAGARLRR